MFKKYPLNKIKHRLWPVLVGVLSTLLMLEVWQDFADRRITVSDQGQQTETVSQPAHANNSIISYAEAVERASPAVVNIYTQTRVAQPLNPLWSDPFFSQFFDTSKLPQRERIQSSLGSGVILSPNGYVVTNNHVIDEADSIVVSLRDGREALATVVGTDPETDLAILKINLIELPSIQINPSRHQRVGDVVLAIGNPFGVGQTVTQGIISAVGRNSIGLNTFENFIQTDAAINPGNSGGALVNPHGELIGINTAIFSQSGGSHGIGFAIPIDTASTVLEDLINHGRVIRGWLGVETQDIFPKLAEAFNVGTQPAIVVTGVVRDGPAHQAGLQPGDIILRMNDEAVTNGLNLMHKIARTKPGETIVLQVQRQETEMTLQVFIQERLNFNT